MGKALKLEQQVVSLEIAQKIKELGMKQESLFYWIYTDAPLKDGSRNKVVAGSTLGDSHWELGGDMDKYSAFTVAELGEMLPVNFRMEKLPDGWQGCIVDLEGEEDDFIFAAEEAQVRGKMLIYLLENKLIPNHPTKPE